MATGNILLGDVRGSFGAVTFRKVNGEQVIQAKPATRKLKKYTYTQMIDQAALATCTKLASAFKLIINVGWFSTRAKYDQITRWKRVAIAHVKRQGKAERKAKAPASDSITRFTPKQTDTYVPINFPLTKSNNPLACLDWVDDAQAFRARVMSYDIPLRQWLNYAHLSPGNYLVFAIVSVTDQPVADFGDPTNPANVAYSSVVMQRIFKVKQPDPAHLDLPWASCYWHYILEYVGLDAYDRFLSWQLSDYIHIPDFHGAAQAHLPHGAGGIACLVTSSLEPAKGNWYTNTVMHVVNPHLFGIDYQGVELSYAGYREIITFTE